MNQLCIGDLAKLVGGRLRFGSMPPLHGDLEPVKRIVVDVQLIEKGDIFLGLDRPGCGGSQYAEQAFIRGALGVVVSGRKVEPWAGKFAIEVEDTNESFSQLVHSHHTIKSNLLVGARRPKIHQDVAAPSVMQAKLSKALPFVSVLREIGTPFPPG